VLDGPVAKREVALLLEDLAGGRRLRTVGHLVRCLDRLADFLEEPGTFGPEGGPVPLGFGRVHLWTLRAGGPWRTCTGEDFWLVPGTMWRIATPVGVGTVGS
jgi:hypothetical protein